MVVELDRCACDTGVEADPWALPFSERGGAADDTDDVMDTARLRFFLRSCRLSLCCIGPEDSFLSFC